MGICAT